MKRLIFSTILGLTLLNCFSQDNNDKYLVGASATYRHDDLTNNSLLSNYYPYDKNLSNAFNFTGEFGYFKTPNSLLGVEIGYYLNSSKQEREIRGTKNADILNIKTSGISINPKYKFIKRFSDKIWFYTDCKILFQYLSHKNEVTELDQETYQYRNLNLNGMEFKYGVEIDPGMIFKISKSFGIKIDYSLFDIVHSKIEKTNSSDFDFSDIKAWDYGLNMTLSGFNLGLIFTL
jgi:hypothetical protein